jgi:hypothetical protein
MSCDKISGKEGCEEYILGAWTLSHHEHTAANPSLYQKLQGLDVAPQSRLTQWCPETLREHYERSIVVHELSCIQQT